MNLLNQKGHSDAVYMLLHRSTITMFIKKLRIESDDKSNLIRCFFLNIMVSNSYCRKNSIKYKLIGIFL